MKRFTIAVWSLATVVGLSPIVVAAGSPASPTGNSTTRETRSTEHKEEKSEVTRKAGSRSSAMQKEAKVSMAEARAIAVKRAPGKVSSEELEREHGNLIYSFDISTGPGVTTEVNVSAIDGKILAVQKENAAKEAAEKKQEAKEKKQTSNPRH